MLFCYIELRLEHIAQETATKGLPILFSMHQNISVADHHIIYSACPLYHLSHREMINNMF